MTRAPPASPRVPHGDLRPLLHAAMGLFAFALGVLPRWGAIAAACAAVAFTWLLLPRLAVEGRLRRPGKRTEGGNRGVQRLMS